VRTDLIKFSLLVALAAVLAIATINVYNTPSQIPPPDSAPAAEVLFRSKGCSGCHTLEGVADQAQLAPDLTNLSDRASSRVAGLTAEQYVVQSLLEPQAFIVPGFDGAFVQMPTLVLSDDEVEALVGLLLDDR
jgi:mono/diheme cytochrome c family protein